MRYRLAIFDFDGTLADSFPWFTRVINDLAEAHGFRRIDASEVQLLRGLDTRQLLRYFKLPIWRVPRLAAEMRRRMGTDIDQIRLFDGIDDLFLRLQASGVKIAIVTSNAEENVRRVLGPANAARVGFYGCGASLLGKGPKIRRAIREAGVAPSEAICVGDEGRDIEAAHAEGAAAGAVLWGYATEESLRRQGADEVFASIEELAERLSRAG